MQEVQGKIVSMQKRIVERRGGLTVGMLCIYGRRIDRETRSRMQDRSLNLWCDGKLCGGGFAKSPPLDHP
jgi:hypothetical protein